MVHVICANMPRTGHHLLERLIRASLPGHYRYCEFHQAPGCCKQIPCTKHGGFAGNAEHVFMQKNHDFRLDCPRQLHGRYRYLIQVRHPLPRLFSHYDLQVRSESVPDTAEDFEFFLAREAAYNVLFLQKWAAQPGPGDGLVRYEDLTSDAAGSLQAIFAAWEMAISTATIAAAVEKCMPYKDMKGTRFQGSKQDGHRRNDPARLQAFEEFIFSRTTAGGYGPTIPGGARDADYAPMFAQLAESQMLQMRDEHEAAWRMAEQIPAARRSTVVQRYISRLSRWEEIKQQQKSVESRVRAVTDARDLPAEQRARQLVELSDVLLREGHANHAAQAARDASDLMPGDAGLMIHAARLCAGQGRYGQAVALCRAAVRAEPGNAGYWFYAGTVMEHQDRLPDALECGIRALALEPKNREFRALLKRVRDRARGAALEEKGREFLAQAETVLRAGGR